MRPCLLAFLILLFSSKLLAQIDFGFKSGLTLSSAIMGPSEAAIYYDFNASIGGFAGVFTSFDLSSHIDLRSELLFQQRRYNYANGEIREQYNYLSLPILLAFRIKDFKLEAGPELGYRFRPKAIQSDGTQLSLFFRESRFAIGLQAGIRYQWQRWELSARYYQELNRLYPGVFTNENGEPLRFVHHMQSITVCLGYILFWE